MKRLKNSILGVTLLEIMLVLAIAAMVIVMSIRYYQSATTAQQANTVLQLVQSITAAADNLAAGSGAYNSTAFTDANIAAIIGSVAYKTPMGTSPFVSSASSTTYTVSIPLSPGVCASVLGKIVGNSKMTGASCNGITLTYVYNSMS